jgi:hypothetical protein
MKLGLSRQFLEALQRDENCFHHLCNKFPGLSVAKFKEGIFVGPDVRNMISGEMSERTVLMLKEKYGLPLKM